MDALLALAEAAEAAYAPSIQAPVSSAPPASSRSGLQSQPGRVSSSRAPPAFQQQQQQPVATNAFSGAGVDPTGATATRQQQPQDGHPLMGLLPPSFLAALPPPQRQQQPNGMPPHRHASTSPPIAHNRFAAGQGGGAVHQAGASRGASRLSDSSSTQQYQQQYPQPPPQHQQQHSSSSSMRPPPSLLTAGSNGSVNLAVAAGAPRPNPGGTQVNSREAFMAGRPSQAERTAAAVGAVARQLPAMRQMQAPAGGSSPGAAQHTQTDPAAMARQSAALAAAAAAVRMQGNAHMARIASAKYAAEAYHAQKKQNFEESARVTALWKSEQQQQAHQQAQLRVQQQKQVLATLQQHSRLQGSGGPGVQQHQQQGQQQQQQHGQRPPSQVPGQLVGAKRNTPELHSQGGHVSAPAANTAAAAAAAAAVAAQVHKAVQQLPNREQVLADLTQLIQQGTANPAAAGQMLSKVFEYYARAHQTASNQVSRASPGAATAAHCAPPAQRTAAYAGGAAAAGGANSSTQAPKQQQQHAPQGPTRQQQQNVRTADASRPPPQQGLWLPAPQQQQHQVRCAEDAQALMQDINGLEQALQRLKDVNGRWSGARHQQQQQQQQQQQAASPMQHQGHQQQQQQQPQVQVSQALVKREQQQTVAAGSPARGVSPQFSGDTAAGLLQGPLAAHFSERSSSQTPEPHDAAFVLSVKQRLINMPEREKVLRQVFGKLYVDINTLTAGSQQAVVATATAPAATQAGAGQAQAGAAQAANKPVVAAAAAAAAPESGGGVAPSPEPGSASAEPHLAAAASAFRAAADRNKQALMWEATAAVLDNKEPRVRMARSQYGGTRRVVALGDMQAMQGGAQALEALQKLLLIPHDLPPGAHIICEVALPPSVQKRPRSDTPVATAQQQEPAVATGGDAGAAATAARSGDEQQQKQSKSKAEASIRIDLTQATPAQQQEEAKDTCSGQLQSSAAHERAAGSPFAAPHVAATVAAAVKAECSSEGAEDKSKQQAALGVVVVHAHAGLDSGLLSDDVATLSTGSKRSREEQEDGQEQRASPLAAVAASTDQPAAKRPYRAELFL